jgi:long-chain acyl-CoA synthetase
MPDTAIGNQFQRVCRDKRDLPAVRGVSTGRNVTFGELSQECIAIENTLRDVGVDPGAAVVSLIHNEPICFSLLVACMAVGAALVPLGDVTEAEALRLTEQIGATAVITNRELPVRTVRARRLGADASIYKLADDASRRSYPPSVMLKLTSGSTERPKAVIASELHLINDGRHIIDAMDIRPEDVNLACIPLSHSYGVGNVLMPLLWQGTAVALRQSFSPSSFLSDVTTSGATVLPGVPFMFERIKLLDDIDRFPPSFRLMISAGARIDPETVMWFKNRLDRKIHSFYGSSETGGISYDDSETVDTPLHVGRPMPETAISIVATDDEQRQHQGRIFVAGNAVTAGYATPIGAEDSGFVDRGFRTGDLGYLDDAGRVILTGRVSSALNVSGRKVDPTEVEQTLMTVPGIADVRVLGTASETRGQEVVAFVIRSHVGVTPLFIRQRCAETLSAHKIPRRFVFLDRFPIDARGKLDRQALADRLLEATDDD